MAIGPESAELIVKTIDLAVETIYMLAYTLDHPDIVEALIRASRKRGVSVYIAYDETTHSKGHSRQNRAFAKLHKECDKLVMKGVLGPVISREMNYVDPSITAPMHHKCLIVDSISVVAGGFNFTEAAATGPHENCRLTEYALDV